MEESTACAQGAIIAASFSSKLQQLISDRLNESSFCGRFVAVRSSGTDEDSASHSFAGDQCSKICESQKILQAWQSQSTLYFLVLIYMDIFEVLKA